MNLAQMQEKSRAAKRLAMRFRDLADTVKALATNKDVVELLPSEMRLDILALQPRITEASAHLEKVRAALEDVKLDASALLED
jgi:hypothetical protein